MLRKIRIRGVGPMHDVEFGLDSRLNVFTGDNGLGKSLILDVAFRSISGSWARDVAVPDLYRSISSERSSPAKIGWEYQSSAGSDSKTRESSRRYEREIFFDLRHEGWRRTPSTRRPSSAGLEWQTIVVYATVDGGFAIFDAMRMEVGIDPDARDLNDYDKLYSKRSVPGKPRERAPGIYLFSQDEIFNGLDSFDRRSHFEGYASNGLLRDIPDWQYRHKDRFAAFKAAVARLSSEIGERIEIGQAKRISRYDSREIPHLRLAYGEIPITQASAAIKRIVSLAYIIVWAWFEHVEASRLTKRKPFRDFLFLFDEVESHLHPRGQRAVLPAVLATITALAKQAAVQILATTHSPLVLASLEPEFNEKRDQLLLVELDGLAASVRREPFVRMGRADDWLTSDMFGLSEPTNATLEKELIAADKVLSASEKPSISSIRALRQRIGKLVEDTDPILARLAWLERGRGQKLLPLANKKPKTKAAAKAKAKATKKAKPKVARKAAMIVSRAMR